METEKIENRITELEDIGNRDGLTIREFSEYQTLNKELALRLASVNTKENKR